MPGTLPRASDATDLKGGLATATFLNQCKFLTAI